MNKVLLIFWLIAGAVIMLNGFVTVAVFFLTWASLLCSILYNIFDREERDYEQV